MIASAVELPGAHAQSPASPPAREDWARLVPGEARFYAELSDLASVREHFRRLGIWKLVLDLSERDQPGATTRPWARRAQESLGLGQDEVVNQLFARRVALMATDSSRWQQGVLLGQLAGDADVAALLGQWSAQRSFEEGDVRCYRLRGGLRLALRGSTIALGPSEDGDGLWGRTVLLMAGRRGPHLAARSEFASLRSRLSRPFAGLVYGQWADDEPAVAGCNRLMVGFDVSAEGITSEWQGQLVRPTERTKPLEATEWSLPADAALMTWSFRHDWDARAAATSQPTTLFDRLASLAVTVLLEPGEGEDRLLNLVGPNYTIVLSCETAGDGAADLPVVSAVVDSRAPAEHVRQLDRLVSLFVMMFASFADSKDPIRAGAVQQTRHHGVEVHHVALGPVLARRFETPSLEAMQVAWTAVDQRLVLSTSVEGVRQLIDALRRGPAKQKGDASKLTERLEVRGAATARLIASWLAHMRAHRPEMTQPAWWKSWAGGQFSRINQFGVALVNDPESPGRAIVRDLQLTSPARPHLEYGDVIVAVNGASLPQRGAAQEVARRYQQRGEATTFELEVLRRDEIKLLRIPVAPAEAPDLRDFDPILALDRLALLLGRVDVLRFERVAGRPDRLDARLTVTWSAGP